MALCKDCGLDYEEHGVDITFPHSQWNLLIGNDHGGGVLCGTCIAKRASNIAGCVAIRAKLDVRLTGGKALADAAEKAT